MVSFYRHNVLLLQYQLRLLRYSGAAGIQKTETNTKQILPNKNVIKVSLSPSFLNPNIPDLATMLMFDLVFMHAYIGWFQEICR